MDSAAKRLKQGPDPAAYAAATSAGGDWRTQMQPEARSRIANKMCAHSLHFPFLLSLSDGKQFRFLFHDSIRLLIHLWVCA